MARKHLSEVCFEPSVQPISRSGSAVALLLRKNPSIKHKRHMQLFVKTKKGFFFQKAKKMQAPNA